MGALNKGHMVSISTLLEVAKSLDADPATEYGRGIVELIVNVSGQLAEFDSEEVRFAVENELESASEVQHGQHPATALLSHPPMCLCGYIGTRENLLADHLNEHGAK